MVNISTAVRGHYGNDGYLWAIIIRRFCDIASKREEIATIAVEINPKELEIPAKRPSILAPPKEADIKQIDLGTGDPSKMTTISAHLSAK
jgi:hypothetical protein